MYLWACNRWSWCWWDKCWRSANGLWEKVSKEKSDED